MGTSFISLNDLKRNFAEVKAGMKPKEAIEESNRCLYCYDAPCIRACPTGIEIPSFIKRSPPAISKALPASLWMLIL